MRKKHHAPKPTHHPGAPPPEASDFGPQASDVGPQASDLGPQASDIESQAPPGPPGGPTPEAIAPPPAVDPAAETIARLESELAEQKDRLLRTAADFDNFRKRAAKEKAEAWGRAQADLIQRLLEVVDDLGRVAHLDPAQTSAQALHEGMGLVEKKLLKAFETAGVERIDPSGSAFDPNAHEAVMTVPAPAADQDGQVASVFQSGYRMGGALLRPARVAVHVWTEPVVPEGAN